MGAGVGAQTTEVMLLGQRQKACLIQRWGLGLGPGSGLGRERKKVASVSHWEESQTKVHLSGSPRLDEATANRGCPLPNPGHSTLASSVGGAASTWSKESVTKLPPRGNGIMFSGSAMAQNENHSYSLFNDLSTLILLKRNPSLLLICL